MDSYRSVSCATERFLIALCVSLSDLGALNTMIAGGMLDISTLDSASSMLVNGMPAKLLKRFRFIPAAFGFNLVSLVAAIVCLNHESPVVVFLFTNQTPSQPPRPGE